MYQLYLLYHSRVARLLGRISLQSGLVDEMVNDTFLVVWKRAGDFRGDTRVATWVYGIAYSRWRMTLRKQMRSPNRGRAFLPGFQQCCCVAFYPVVIQATRDSGVCVWPRAVLRGDRRPQCVARSTPSWCE